MFALTHEFTTFPNLSQIAVINHGMTKRTKSAGARSFEAPFPVKYIDCRVARWAVFLPSWAGFKVGLRVFASCGWAVLGGFCVL